MKLKTHLVEDQLEVQLLVVEALLVRLAIEWIDVAVVGRVVQVLSGLLLILSCLVRDVLLLQEGRVVVVKEVAEGPAVGERD